MSLSLARGALPGDRPARRAAVAGLRWSAGRPARRLLARRAVLACMTVLAALWTVQGRFHGGAC